MSESTLLSFYRYYYYQTLQDRDYLQSKMNVFSYFLASSFIFVIWAINYLYQHSTLIKTHTVLICVFTTIILFIGIFLFIILCKFFLLKKYSELPIPRKIQDNFNQYSTPQDKEEILLQYYMQAIKNNVTINDNRRSILDIVVILFIIQSSFILFSYILLVLYILQYGIKP